MALQKVLYRQLLTHPTRTLHYENRIRKKLERWKLPTPIGILARRARKRVEMLSSFVAPRVLAAVFKTWWNGWCTARRFKKIGNLRVLLIHPMSPRVRFRNAMTGVELLLSRVCTKVRDHVTVEWYFKYVAEVLERPSQFIRLVVLGLDGDSRVVTYTKLLSEQSHTLLTSLQQDSEAVIWVGVLLDAAPSDYTQAACQGLCICDFGGCCRRCSVPDSKACCGSDGCCHAGTCGHKCCESFGDELTKP